MKDCEGCGFTFKTDRGCRGNIYVYDGIIHVCDYCGHETYVPYAPARKARPS